MNRDGDGDAIMVIHVHVHVVHNDNGDGDGDTCIPVMVMVMQHVLGELRMIFILTRKEKFKTADQETNFGKSSIDSIGYTAMHVHAFPLHGLILLHPPGQNLLQCRAEYMY